MFEAMGWRPLDDEAEQLEDASRRFFEHHAALGGDVIAWVAEEGILPVGAGVIQLRARLPQPGFVDNEPEAYILNMWTEPGFRRRGVATRLLQAMTEWCRTRGIRRVSLHASEDGRALYLREGFAPSTEMRMTLPR